MTTTITEEIEACAATAFEALRHWDIAHGIDRQAQWRDLDPRIQQTFRNGAHGVVVIGDTVASAHERWCEDMRSQGWKRGAVKSDLMQVHPALCLFGELQSADQRKTEIFVRSVRMMAKALGILTPSQKPAKL